MSNFNNFLQNRRGKLLPLPPPLDATRLRQWTPPFMQILDTPMYCIILLAFRCEHIASILMADCISESRKNLHFLTVVLFIKFQLYWINISRQ